MMTVKTIDPNKPAITMTKKAGAYLRQQMQSRNCMGLRLSVKESGCNGFKYVLDFIDQPEGDDSQIVVEDGVNVYVAKGALRYLLGTQIDYVTEGLNQSIKFINPNASAECGCGESFSV